MNKELFKQRKMVNPGQKRVCMILIFSFLSLMTIAQEIKITGIVYDEVDKTTLVGASVVIKGTTVGTITDANGIFKITASKGDVLVISYIGYTSQELVVGNKPDLIIRLEPAAKRLEGVVVVGYGTQPRVNISGAVSSLRVEELESRPISSLAQGLVGAIPNLNIEYHSGEPGSVANINIRGFTSINEGSALILIDGVTSDASDLNKLAPEDIESISVLKDASSAAIFGAQAAFGVILITTRTGKTKGLSVSYNNNFSTGMPTVLPNKITDPYIYLRLKETSTDNTPWDNQNFSDITYQWAKERSDNPENTPGVRIDPTDPTLWAYMGNRDWSRYFLNNQTLAQRHHISVQGASERTSYFVSAGYDRQSGVLAVADDFFDRYSIRSRVGYEITNWLTVGNNTNIINTLREHPSYFDMWTIYNLHPTDWDVNPDGSHANTTAGRTAARLTDGGRSVTDFHGMQSTFTTELSLIKDVLRINANYTYRKDVSDHNSYFTKYRIGFGPADIREEGTNEALRSSTNERYSAFNVYATFNETFGRIHQVTAITGFNQESSHYNWFMAQRDGIVSASLPTIGLATGTAEVDEFISEWAIRGLFGRLNYILMDRYILEFNGRLDGSSRFPENNRFGFFPSVSAAWLMHREDFMSDVRFISNLKPRISFGSLGNQLVDDFGYIATMQTTRSNFIIGGELPQRVLPPQLVSPNYTWEVIETLNAGLDLELFDGRLSAMFDIYQRNTKGMLTQGRALPNVIGAAEPLENASDLQTSGWEFSLGYRNTFTVAGRPLFLGTRFILSDSRTIITRFDNPNNNLIQFYEGMELGEIWGLESDGLFQTQAEIDALDQSAIIPWGALAIVPGWPKYVDQDGNSAIETGLTVDDPKDLKVIGNISPRFRFGVNLAANWSGFDFRVFVQGVGKRDFYPLDHLYWGFFQQPYAGGYMHLTDFFRYSDDSPTQMARHSQSFIDAGLAHANRDARYPVLQAWLADRNLGERIDQAKGLAIPQTGYLLNAGYVRLKNLTIGYTLPRRVSQELNLSSVRVFFSGENLFEWSEVRNFFDPEAINDIDVRFNPGANPSRIEAKGYAYPFQRRYSFGVNLNF